METRSIAIGLVAIVAAFAAAFGMAKSGGSKTETAGAGVKAQSIKLAAPAAVTGVEVGGTVPALRTVHKAPAKKKAASTTNTSSNTSNTSSNTSNTSSNTSAPSTNNTTAAPKVQTPVAPKKQTAKPPAKPVTPIQSGGDDG